MPDNIERETFRGWLLYDGECALCTSLACRLGHSLQRRGFGLAPLQASWVSERLGPETGELLKEMRVLTAEGQTISGADALLYIAKRVWWAWPLSAIAQLPGTRRVLQSAYRWIAERRHCLDGACMGPRTSRWFGWVPLAVFPLVIIAFRSDLPAWAFMWTLAITIYFGLKWLTWWRAKAVDVSISRRRSLGYLLLWPGMDAHAFLDVKAKPPKPTAAAWLTVFLKTAFGAVLLWGIARMIPPHQPVLTGWIGLLGLIFLFHFGIFHILALLWQRAGIVASPIMRAPALATSLSDFWSNRWNLAFRQLSHDLLFQPLHKRVGVAGALVIVFLASGLLHELVISVPAGAGYGLPTAYFVLQALGVLVERSAPGKRFGLRRGLSGWVFAVLLTASPAFWLFHRPFVVRVVIPFMHVIGAL